MPFVTSYLKNSEIKTTLNTFRDCCLAFLLTFLEISVNLEPPSTGTPFKGPSTCNQNNTSGYKPPPPHKYKPPSSLYLNELHFLRCFEAKKGIKFKKNFEKHSHVACFKTVSYFHRSRLHCYNENGSRGGRSQGQKGQWKRGGKGGRTAGRDHREDKYRWDQIRRLYFKLRENKPGVCEKEGQSDNGFSLYTLQWDHWQ